MIKTTLCYIEDPAGRYLMLHRTKKEGDINRDKWIGIGGKFEPGETPEACLLREVGEETGLTLTAWRYCGVIGFSADGCPEEEMHLFHATGYEGTPIECDEGELEWIDKTEFRRLPMWEGDALFLDLMDRQVDFFRMRLHYRGDRLVYAERDGEILRQEK